LYYSSEQFFKTVLFLAAESLLRCQQFLRRSKEFSPCTEPEGSLPYSEWPTTDLCPKADQSIPQPLSYAFKIHFRIILLPMPRSLKWDLPFAFSG
jgi:hypothetical protein